MEWTNVFSQTTEADKLVAMAHYCLISMECLCLGVGTQPTLGENDSGTRDPPAGWNENGRNGIYNLRYKRLDRVYLMQVNQINDIVFMNFLEYGTTNANLKGVSLSETMSKIPNNQWTEEIEAVVNDWKQTLFGPILTPNVTAPAQQYGQSWTKIAFGSVGIFCTVGFFVTFALVYGYFVYDQKLP